MSNMKSLPALQRCFTIAVDDYGRHDEWYVVTWIGVKLELSLVWKQARAHRACVFETLG